MSGTRKSILAPLVVCLAISACAADPSGSGSPGSTDAAGTDTPGEGPSLEELQELWGGGDRVLSVVGRRQEAVQGQDTVVLRFEVETSDGRLLDCGARFFLNVRDEWQASGDEDCEVLEILGFGSVQVGGESLPILDPSTDDDAVGMTAPTLTGEDTSGALFEIGPDGQAKIVLFVSHSSNLVGPEIAAVQSVIDAGEVPEGVGVYAVHTRGDPELEGWPPGAFMESAGWSLRTMADSEESSAAEAYGVGGVPFYVVLSGSNEVIGRIPGAVGADGFRTLLDVASN